MAGSLEKSPAKLPRLKPAERTAALKALADPRRFELLERIAGAGCPAKCMELGEAMPISAATLSHHLKELEGAGLIEVRREGKFHFLTVKPEMLRALADTLLLLAESDCGTAANGSDLRTTSHSSDSKSRAQRR